MTCSYVHFDEPHEECWDYAHCHARVYGEPDPCHVKVEVERSHPTPDMRSALVEELYSLGEDGETLVRIEEAVSAINSRWSIETRHRELKQVALEKYGQHTGSCARTRYEAAPWEKVLCDCGGGTGSIHDTKCPRAISFKANIKTWEAHLRDRQCTCGLAEALAAD